MLKRLPEIFLGALLAVAIFAFGFVAASVLPSRDQQETQQSKSDAAKKTEQVIKSESADDRIALYTLWLAILTGGLVFVSGFQGYFLLRTDKTAAKSADAARKSAEHIPRVERAYVFLFDEVRHARTPNPLGGTILEIQFAFKNHGKTPAISDADQRRRTRHGTQGIPD